MTVNCDYCGAPAELVGGDVLYPHRSDLVGKKFWRCVPCGAYVGTHANSKTHEPLGRLANAELRKAKQAAHALFDPFWHSQGWKRRRAYSWLAEQMGKTRAEAHIGKFDVPECQKLIAILNEQKERIEA